MSYGWEIIDGHEGINTSDGGTFDPDKRIQHQKTDAGPGITSDVSEESKGKRFDPNERILLIDSVREQPEHAEPQSIEDVRRWLPEINPDYDPYNIDTCTNCGSCALAVLRRLEGAPNAVAGPGTLSIPEMQHLIGKKQVSMSPEEIRQRLIQQGPGSCAIIGIDRKDGPGHWFCGYCPDGVHVYALDGQTGAIQGWPPDYGNVSNWDMSL